MKFVIWTLSIIVALAVLAFVYFTRGTFTTSEPTTPAPTATPVVTPTVAPTATPAPTTTPTKTPTPVVTPTITPMTAEEFFRDLHERPSKYAPGTNVTITGIVAAKDDRGFEFSVPYNESVRGRRTFTIIVEIRNRAVDVGERITVEGETRDGSLNNWVTIKATKLSKN